MNLSDDPWELPSARAFLSEIEGEAARGGSIVTGGPSLPAGLNAAIARHFQQGSHRDRGYRIEHIESGDDRLPAEALAGMFGATAEAGALARDTGLTDHLAIVAAEVLTARAMSGWLTFLTRFLKERAGRSEGLAVLLLPPGDASVFGKLPLVDWNGRLRRIDVTIWADLHAPLDRPEPLATLAAALAVDLCGWRLDLAAEIAQARRQDLLDPFGWLQLRSGQAATAPCRLNGREMACPLALCAQGKTDEIRIRIWKAQVAALFPWLEAHRQRVIDRHRKLLRIDVHLPKPGGFDVDDLEFGGLGRQLRHRIGRAESDLIDCLAALRNDLAHRRVVQPNMLDQALREAQQFDTGG